MAEKCSRCHDSGFVWEVVKTTYGGRTCRANVQTWCPDCHPDRAKAEKQQKTKRGGKRQPNRRGVIAGKERDK